MSSAPAARDDLIGRTLDDRYEIREALAPVRDGSIGAMYRGYQPSVARDVAIKIVHAQYARDPAAVDRFLHAGRTAAQLVGPALANVYDVGRSPDGIVYVVSELARGVPLLEHVGRAMPARRVVGLALQLVDALAAVHRQRIAHGDLDLASLVVDETGDRLKVLDVGLSASLVPARPGYAAPELLDPGQRPTIASDLYAVGAILYELLVGTPPFVAASLEALAGKHRHEPPPQLPPNIPVSLAAIVQRLLAKYPNERHATAADLRAALLEVQGEVGIAIARTSSNPNIALPRTASADYGQPAIARTASADYQPQLPRTVSADFGQPQLPRTASADFGQLQLPRTVSADLSSYPVVSRAASRQLAGDDSSPAAPSSRRWLVIVLVALIASGGGIAAILLVG